MSGANGFPNLADAEVGKELVPDISVMLRHIAGRGRSKRVGLKNNAINGEIVDDTMEQYLAKKPHIGSSNLKEVFKSPLSFYFEMHYKKETETKKVFELGTFCHKAFLEPKLFDSLIVEPEAKMSESKGVQKLIDFWTGKISSSRADASVIISNAVLHIQQKELDINKMEGKKEYLDYLKCQSGMTSVPENTKTIIDLIKRQYLIYGGGIIPEILKHANKECSFYGNDPATGLPVKVRPDAYNTEENIGVNAIISMKTTSALTLDKFMYDTAKFEYELSEGMYQEVVSHVTGKPFNVTIMIMLQTVPPYSPAVFWWMPEDIVNGKDKYHYALSMVKDCYDKGIFSGFDVFAERDNRGVIELKQPEWAHKMIAPVETEL